MKNFRDILEARGDTAVFTFGRFNPPTTGHEKLIDALAKQQSKNAGSVMYVYPSHSQNPKKDPLPHALKTAYMRKMFPKYRGNIIAGKERNVFDIAVTLHKKGHKSIIMVVGSDRVAEFERLLNTYNGVDGKHGYYGFDNIEVVSAGERDPDAEGVTGMSASKMRAAASSGDFDSFKTGVPSSFKDSQKLYNDVRKNMGIREEREMGEMNDFETLRDMYLTGKLWNVGDLVEANGVEGRIIRKGTNYVAFNDNTGKVHKAWLHDIVERDYKKEYANYQGTPEQIARRSSRNQARRVMGDKAIQGMDVGHKDNDPMNNDPSNLKNEDPSVNRREPRLREIKQDPDIKKSKGTEPAKYYAKDAKGKDMAVSTKKARDTHFTKGAKMDDDNPAAYKQAPGDKGKKTKPSTHTKKFKQMYGEALPKNADQGDYIDDFAKSDAPQFKGKSKEKRKDMAIAAYLSKNESVLDFTLETLNEDGHTDVASMKNKVQIAMNALQKMQMELNKIGDENDLPTWWTNKVATAVARLDDMADYLDVKVEKNVDEDKKFTAGKYKITVHSKPSEKSKPKPKSALGKKFNLVKSKDEEKTDESLWANIHKKRQRIKQGSGEKMRKAGSKGAPTPSQLKRAKGESIDEDVYHLDEKIAGLIKKAEKSGMPYGILKKVYDRGMAAWRTGHRPGTTPQQWAFARVNSFTTKSSGTWGKADKDLAKQVRGESVELKNAWGEITEAAEYQGRKVQLNNPTKGDVKKYKVYVRNDKGNVVKVEFGDPNMQIKRDDPARRKAFRARHNCDTKKDKTTAGYWSCKFWSGKSVTDLMKG
tara:strand:+ start:602 stop:3049 length:2448 start_codon:yes stop_codon:yes gene_type:complete